MGSGTPMAGAALSDALTVRAASGFSHSKAIKAAIRSHTIMAQNTFQ